MAGTANGVVFNGFLSHNHNAGAKSILELKYGTTVDLNANLTLFETRLEINGRRRLYAGPRPVPCTITVTSGRGTPAQATASKTLSLINAGVYAYPFTSFPGVDFTDVDMITVRFDSSAYTSVDYAIGPFRTDGETVPVESATWVGSSRCGVRTPCQRGLPDRERPSFGCSEPREVKIRTASALSPGPFFICGGFRVPV